jgi:hypothetical protein
LIKKEKLLNMSTNSYKPMCDTLLAFIASGDGGTTLETAWTIGLCQTVLQWLTVHSGRLEETIVRGYKLTDYAR